MTAGTVALVIILCLLLHCDSFLYPLIVGRFGGLAMSKITNTELVAAVQKAIEHHKAGNVPEAIEYYEKALPHLAGNTKASMSGNVGSLYMNQGNYERAAYHFTAAVDADGSNPSAHYNLAVILTTKLGQHAKAIKHCGKAMQLDPENYKAHHLMGNIMQAIGRPAEAEKYFVAAENLALKSKGAGSTSAGKFTNSALERLGIMGTKLGDVLTVSMDNVEYSVECVSERPLVFVVDHLITDEECEHIINKARGLLERSYVMGGGAESYAAGKSQGKASQECSSTADGEASCEASEVADPALYRSSYNAWLPQDAVLDGLQRRLSHILGISAAYLKQKSEQLQVVRYTPGGQFKPHQDSSAFNTRLVTALLYLNSPTDSGGSGGETWFPYTAGAEGAVPETVEASVRTALDLNEAASAADRALPGLKVSPLRGRAVIFFNHLSSGAVDPAAVHAGLPVLAPAVESSATPGVEKWVANYWVELDEAHLVDHVL